jgi:hypothetical protein
MTVVRSLDRGVDMNQSTDRSVEDELDAALAALAVPGSGPTYSRAILEGFALRRPTLVGGLSDLASIPADRLAAATAGQLELEPEEIDRIEDAADLCAMEMATAAYPPIDDGGGLGTLFKEMVDAERARFEAVRAAMTRQSAG